MQASVKTYIHGWILCPEIFISEMPLHAAVKSDGSAFRQIKRAGSFSRMASFSTQFHAHAHGGYPSHKLTASQERAHSHTLSHTHAHTHTNARAYTCTACAGLLFRKLALAVM